jgi:hypothetical protein
MQILYLMIALLLVCIVIVNALPQGRKTSPFWCRKCKGAMDRGSHVGRALPQEVYAFLHRHNLPTYVVTRYVCPKGHTQLWFVPKLGNTDKSMFVVRDL